MNPTVIEVFPLESALYHGLKIFPVEDKLSDNCEPGLFNNRTQSLEFFQNIFKFSTFLPKFSNFHPFLRFF